MGRMRRDVQSAGYYRLPGRNLFELYEHRQMGISPNTLFIGLSHHIDLPSISVSICLTCGNIPSITFSSFLPALLDVDVVSDTLKLFVPSQYDLRDGGLGMRQLSGSPKWRGNHPSATSYDR